ncbi:MAG: hypothetical protein K6E49_07005 [Lachnospiraceae bacterium]|nr:hypothetical protein [Lachnospiraceae bacterium]
MKSSYKYNDSKSRKPVIIILTVIVCVAAALFGFEYLTGLLTAADSSDTSYDFDYCVYYDSLSDEDREIYEMFYDLAMHRNVSGYSRKLSMDRFEFAAGQDNIISIYHAMLNDHPELFYLEGTTGRDLDIRGFQAGFMSALTFRLGPGSPDEDEMIEKFDKATKNFMSSIDLTASASEIERQIHDKLIDTVTYDHDLLNRDLMEGDLGHTAYGALVADSSGLANRAVCDGYAKAFQYLLRQAGINAAVVTGEADSDSGTLSEQGPHAWNIVELDGDWYEVDSCWDDIDPPPGEENDPFYKIIKYQQPQYDNATHHWYNRTTEEMLRLPASPNTAIRIQQGTMFYELDNCGPSSHIRDAKPDLPIANGTIYGL